jgi:hypothetical protein
LDRGRVLAEDETARRKKGGIQGVLFKEIFSSLEEITSPAKPAQQFRAGSFFDVSKFVFYLL